jgi:hypothetical protein
MQNNDNTITVSDMSNLQNLQQNQSKLHIRVDPTITQVSDIELLPPTQSPKQSDIHQQVPENNQDSDQLNFGPDPQISSRRNSSQTQHSVTVPSMYVQDRIKTLDSQVASSRRRRSYTSIKNYVFNAIVYIVIFYTLFAIGLITLWYILDSYGYKILVQKDVYDTNSTYSVNASDGTNSYTYIENKEDTIYSNVTVPVPIPPKFWEQHLENLTSQVLESVYIYFNTVGTEFLTNSTENIINSTIDKIQTVQLSTLYVTDVMSSTTTSENIISNDIVTNNMFSNYTDTKNIVTERIVTEDIVTERIVTQNITTTSMYSNNIFGSFINIPNIMTQNISSHIINAYEVIATNVNSLALFGNSLNKCNVGKC